MSHDSSSQARPLGQPGDLAANQCLQLLCCRHHLVELGAVGLADGGELLDGGK